MADIRGLEEAFGAASEEARRTFDRLNGTGGRGGLEQDYLIAKEASEKNPTNKTLKQRYTNLKKLYDTAAAEYKRAQDAKNAARKELNAAQGTSEKPPPRACPLSVQSAPRRFFCPQPCGLRCLGVPKL